MNKTVFILHRAKVRIEIGSEEFLCLALKDATPMNDAEAYAAFEELGKRIMTEIKTAGPGVLCVDSWLLRVSPEFKAWRDTLIANGAENVFRHAEYKKQMKQYRLRWIDALIAEYSK